MTRIQLPCAINRHEARERLTDAVWRMADVDHGERILPDDFEPAGPAGVAQARSHGGFDPAAALPAARVSARAGTG